MSVFAQNTSVFVFHTHSLSAFSIAELPVWAGLRVCIVCLAWLLGERSASPVSAIGSSTYQSIFRACVPKQLPYFHVSFGMAGGFAHVIENTRKMNHNFGKVGVLCYLLSCLRLGTDGLNTRRAHPLLFAHVREVTIGGYYSESESDVYDSL